MLNRKSLPGERFKVKLFTGANLEADMNAWLVGNPGALVQLFLAHDGVNPVALALYLTTQ